MRNRKIGKILVMLMVAMMMLALSQGCSRTEKGEKGSTYLTIKGSDTMVHLVSSWAEEYMKIHPGIDISVTGGGSGTGVAALLNGTTDICAASRTMKSKEITLAEEKGMHPTKYVLARDGLAIVVNPDNPVSSLTMDQVKNIFTGAITNWKMVGGNDAEILILSRESNSGTFVFFQEHVLQKEDFAKSSRLMPATSAIIQSVSEDKTTIGYVG
ncbi:phosphate ABC transporter substrate-binding protein, partial [bacterium]|nr:phosphate ABC transporter substrate-binding protein [bacterium]